MPIGKPVTVTMAALTLLFALFLSLHSNAQAQNSSSPKKITEINTNFVWIDSLFSTSVGTFQLGSQWGASDIDKLNSALNLNVTNGNFGYMHFISYNNGVETERHIKMDAAGNLKEGLAELYKLGNGFNDTNYLFWGTPLIDTREHFGFCEYWTGLRWEPAENSGLGRDWAPRDEEAWPFSFAKKTLGTIPTSGENYRRFICQRDTTVSTYPVKVLDEVEPRNQLVIGRSIQWKSPLEERFYRDNDSSQGYAEDTTDCRRMVLVVNLRRLNALDTIKDDSVVASIVVPYQMRWKDQQDDRATDASARILFIV